MIFNQHSNLIGQHAFLSASKHHWIHYTKEKLIQAYNNFQAVERGTRLHDLASRLIDEGIKLPKSKCTLNSYVNDAISFRMITEQPLVYSMNCFGTADAISFKKNHLQIHDLKTGVSPASMDQLLIYAALFCLEYDKDPNKITTELRIYQSDDVTIFDPSPEEIQAVMDTIVEFDKIIDSLDGGK